MPRLFVAVWPPEEILDRVAALNRPEVAGLRWTTRHHWHVTLRFLGEAEIAPVRAALAGVAEGPVTARLGPAVDRFGQRILHLPVSGLDELAGAVVTATARLGRPPDPRPFHGHVTLARVGRTAPIDLRRLAGAPVDGAWGVVSFCLVESQLSPAGARYEVLEQYSVS